MMTMIRQISFLLFLFFAFNVHAQVTGCTDPLSVNYNPAATINDGSCNYTAASVSPVASIGLPAAVVETSGLISWNGLLFTHNDNSDTKLYALDPATGAVVQTINLPGVTNVDWEDIAQDDDYIYIGDFGNNSNGNRTNLKIYKIEKASLLSGSPIINTINFSYSNQGSFTATGGNNTDFDCEAFIVSENNIYLFTKQWVSKKTSVYSLPKNPGTHVASIDTTYNVNGLITGATYLKDKQLVVLTGYSPLMQPFLYLMYGFDGNNFFSGNNRKVTVPLSFHQFEGIATVNGLDYYVTNEKLSQSFLNVAQKLHRFDLRPYLEDYLESREVNKWTGTAWTQGTSDTNLPAIIEGDYNSAMHGGITAASLTVNNGNVIVASGTDFIIKGKVTVAETATMTIEDNANLVQIDNVENTGTLEVEKKGSPLHYLDYTLWSSPVWGDQTLKQFSPQTLDKRFYVYNTDLDSYSNYESASGIFGGTPSDVAFTPAKGYLIRMPYGLNPENVTVFEGKFEGTPNNGDITIALGTGGNRYNAVGNPYPSPINIYDFIDANQANLDNGTLYFWRKTNNPEATSYATINKLAYIANAANGGDTGSNTFTGDPSDWVINPGQGFYIKASADAGQLLFTNSMRRSDNNSQFFRHAPSSANDQLSRFWLNFENNTGGFAQAAIGYSPAGTLGIDFGYDGQLLNQGANAIYTVAGPTKLSIQARPSFVSDDVVQLGYSAGASGSYTISLAKAEGVFAEGQEILIKDKVLNITHNLSGEPYIFSTNEGDNSNRFEIIYASSALGINEIAEPGNDVVVYKQNGELHIDAGLVDINAVTVYDISGRSVYNRNGINTPRAAIKALQGPNQLLVIQIILNDKTIISKKVVN